MNKSGANLVISALNSIGVRTIFTLSGNQIMPIFDACIDACASRPYLSRIENSSAAIHPATLCQSVQRAIGRSHDPVQLEGALRRAIESRLPA